MAHPSINGMASFAKVNISSPVLPRPLSNLFGCIRVEENVLRVEEMEGRVGRKGVVKVKGSLPLDPQTGVKVGGIETVEGGGTAEGDKDGVMMTAGLDGRSGIEVSADALEVRARNVFRLVFVCFALSQITKNIKPDNIKPFTPFVSRLLLVSSSRAFHSCPLGPL